MAESVKQKKSWEPFPPLKGMPFSSQQYFLSSGIERHSAIKEVLYHGTRGVGKTEALLASFAILVGKGYGKKWRGVIFRKEYKALDDVINKSKILFKKFFGDTCVFKESKSDYKWVFATGEELLFRAIDSVQDYDDKFHGQEFSFIGWEELCSWPDLTLYDTMMSCLRTSSDDLDDSNMPPLLVRATTNPFGSGRSAVKKYFIDVAPAGVIFEEDFNVDGEIISKKRMHVFGSYKENPYLNKDYALSFMSLKNSNYNKFKAWLYGDWEAISGGMFGDLWNYDKNAIKPFKIPDNWYIDRSFDYGTASPFSTLWFAESNGESFRDGNGDIQTVPKGSIFVINEYYGCNSISHPNQGLNLNASKIAENIKIRENNMKNKTISLFNKINPGPADNSIWNDSKVSGVKTVADLFSDKGIKWTKSNKAKGSRIAGVEYFKEMLIATANNDTSMPHIYVFNTCKYFISNVPALQIDSKNPEDIDTTQPDHDWDALRYRILNKKSMMSMFNSY